MSDDLIELDLSGGPTAPHTPTVKPRALAMQASPGHTPAAKWWPRVDGAPVYTAPKPGALARGVVTGVINDAEIALAVQAEAHNAGLWIGRAVYSAARIPAPAPAPVVEPEPEIELIEIEPEPAPVAAPPPAPTPTAAEAAPEIVEIQAEMAAPAPAQSEERGVYLTDETLRALGTQAVGVIQPQPLGHGELTRREILSALRDAGLPESWAPPTKTAHAYAAEAVRRLASRYVVTADRGNARTGAKYRARWIVGHKASGVDVGESIGTATLTVTLTTSGKLEYQGSEVIGREVRAEFERCAESDVYRPNDITEWLAGRSRDSRSGLLRTRFAAVRLGGGVWFIPASHAANAARLMAALRDGAPYNGPGTQRRAWGADWCDAMEIARPADVRSNLARGLKDEARAVLAELSQRVADARKEGRRGIGEASAETLARKLRAVAQRGEYYAAILGSECVAEVRKEVRDALVQVSQEIATDGMSERYANLELT